MPTSPRSPWWQTGVLYQVYPRSFADTNGDGVGDLPGVIDHLDHLSWLGVEGIWLSPVTASPGADFGYDVADYCSVDPEYGTLEDLDTLVAEASRRKIRVVLDLVPNHTSDEHSWFKESRSSRSSPKRDWYVWRDPKPDGSPPNNWVSHFGGPAWTLDEATGQYYLHNFLPEQPDLNWWHPEVRDAFDEILRFWFARGIAGFRIDVCHAIVKDAELRDNPPSGPKDSLLEQIWGLRWVYNANRPEVHEVLRRWRSVANHSDPPALLLGETNVDDLAVMASYYGSGADELDLAFNFPFMEAPFEAETLAGVVERTEALLPPGAWPVWTGSNHDVSRLATRWAKGDEAKIRCALLLLVTLRGTPVLYQGDEIGLGDGEVPREALEDRVGKRFWPFYPGRDPMRTPMLWAPGPGRGFTTPGTKPWLPFSEDGTPSVAEQRGDPRSVLTFCRDLIALRAATPALQQAPYEQRPGPEGVWCWRRGLSVTVAVNLSDEKAAVEGIDGRIALATSHGRAHQEVTGRLALGPWEGAVVID